MNKTGEIEIGEQIISFERAETNKVKWLRQKKTVQASTYIAP